MLGLIGKKVGMTSIFDEEGKNIACTVIETGPCVVTQVKSEETDGYFSVQLAFDGQRTRYRTTKFLRRPTDRTCRRLFCRRKSTPQ